MLWEIEILPKKGDPDLDRVCEEYELLTHPRVARDLVRGSSRGYLLESDVGRDKVERLMADLFVDPLVESPRLTKLDCQPSHSENGSRSLTVLLKPGVMDPVAMTVVEAARNFGIQLDSVHTFRRYYVNTRHPTLTTRDSVLARILANDAIERVIEGPISAQHLTLGARYDFHRVIIPLGGLDDTALERVSRDGQLSLSLAEMKTIQAHYRESRREPTDIELETLAQTWSEHCSHKTLRSAVDVEVRDENGKVLGTRLHIHRAL